MLTDKEKQIAASVLTWDACKEIKPEEIVGWVPQNDIAWFFLTDNRAYPIHKQQFRQIKETQEALDYVSSLEVKLAA